MHRAFYQDFSEFLLLAFLNQRTFFRTYEAFFYVLEETYQVSFHSLPLSHELSIPSNNPDTRGTYLRQDLLQFFRQTSSHILDTFSPSKFVISRVSILCFSTSNAHKTDIIYSFIATLPVQNLVDTWVYLLERFPHRREPVLLG